MKNSSAIFYLGDFDGVGHQFYANSFVHSTSVCLILVNGFVHFLSDDGKYNLFCWGGGGNDKVPEGEVNGGLTVVEDNNIMMQVGGTSLGEDDRT